MSATKRGAFCGRAPGKASRDGVREQGMEKNEHSLQRDAPAAPGGGRGGAVPPDAGPLARGAGKGGPPEPEPAGHAFEDRRRKRSVTVRRPGQPGTKALVARYGERFRCLRYVYDRETREKYREIVLLETKDLWEPGPPDPGPEDRVGVAIALRETDLRARVAAAGGRWDRRDKLWYVRYGDIARLGLSGRTLVVKEDPAAYAL